MFLRSVLKSVVDVISAAHHKLWKCTVVSIKCIIIILIKNLLKCKRLSASDRNPAICPWEEAIFMAAQKCPYHVTFDLDLEHTLDARSPGDHCVQVWSQSNHLPARRSYFHGSTKMPVSRDLWPWPWAHPGCALTWRSLCAGLVAIEPFVA